MAEESPLRDDDEMKCNEKEDDDDDVEEKTAEGDKTKKVGKQSQRESRWKRHFPTKESPVACKECGKMFTRADALKAHLASHSGTKAFSCSECGKSFVKARYLREHKRVHSADKRYKCTSCGSSYLKSRYLKSHMKSCRAACTGAEKSTEKDCEDKS